MRVLGLQCRAEEGAVERNVARAIELTRRHVAARKTDLVVLPELVTCGYAGTDFLPWAEPVDGPSVARFARLATELDVLIGFGFAEAAGGKVFNSWALVEPGRPPFVYRKIHLHHARPGNEPADEPRFFAPGDRLGIVDTRLGRLGIQICYDGFFPELARCLVLEGATVLLWPMRCNGGHVENGQVKARALENLVPVVAVDGAQRGKLGNHGGHSAVTDHLGNVLGEFKGQEGVLRAEVDPGKAERDRREGMDGLALFRVRRPELYRAIVEPGLKPWR